MTITGASLSSESVTVTDDGMDADLEPLGDELPADEALDGSTMAESESLMLAVNDTHIISQIERDVEMSMSSEKEIQVE